MDDSFARVLCLHLSLEIGYLSPRISVVIVVVISILLQGHSITGV